MRFSAPVRTGPGDNPASYTMGSVSFSGVKRPERDVNHPPLLAPRLKKEYSNTSTFIMACYTESFTFTLPEGQRDESWEPSRKQWIEIALTLKKNTGDRF